MIPLALKNRLLTGGKKENKTSWVGGSVKFRADDCYKSS